MSSVTVATLSEEEKRRALIRISQFVLRDEIQNVRDELQENIVEMALFWGTTEGQAVEMEEITELVKEELFILTLPEYILQRNLSGLLSKESVRIVEGDKYCLKKSRRKKLAELVQENNAKIYAINEQIIATLIREYGKELSPEQEEEILGNFYSFLASLFLERSNLVAKIVTKKQVDFIPIEFPLRTLVAILAKTHDLKLREAQKKAIVHLFGEASEFFIDFLFSVIQNLVCLQILNFDPECESLEKEAFKRKILFLDTNVLLALLCPTDHLHRVASQLVNLSKMLGAKCVVT